MTQFPSYLHVERTGEGPALMLMHGAGEDSSLLAPRPRRSPSADSPRSATTGGGPDAAHETAGRVVASADALHELIMAPAHAHLAGHPGDWVGAYDLMLMSMSNGQSDAGDPIAAAMRGNAESAYGTTPR